MTAPPALHVDAFDRLRGEGAVVLDCRSPEAFTAHIPGALNVGVGNSFATWAGTVVPAEASVLVVLEHERDLWEVCWQLLRIGYELPKGWLAGGMAAWRTAARVMAVLPQWTVWELHRQLEGDRQLLVLDVRQPQEWADGHIRRAKHITGAELPERADEVPQARGVAVICGSGYRSSVIASLLMARGYPNVVNVLGGMSAWKRAGLEMVQE